MGGKVDPKDEWWLKTEKPPNMRDCNGTEEFLAALAEAGEDTLVVGGLGCTSCECRLPIACNHPVSWRLFGKVRGRLER
jgi:hypothetical protein